MRPPFKYLLTALFLATCLAGFSRRVPLYMAAASAPTSTSTPTAKTIENRPVATAWSEIVPAAGEPALPQPTATPEAAPEYAFGPDDFPNGINPLTGLPAVEPAWLMRRPIAVKITNFPRTARPQWGLNLADQVIEYYIGDDMTRFIGIFYGNQTQRAGPVRSGRLFDEHVMRMYKSFLVFGYADPKVRAELFDDDLIPFLIFETPNNCPPICRIENGLAYNNLFADTKALHRYFKEKDKNDERQDLDGLRFDIRPPAGGQTGERLSIYYTLVSYHRWEFDPERNRYYRYQEVGNDRGQELVYQPLLDMADQEQVSADNLVVLFASHETFYKSSSTWIVDIPLLGQGAGYAFRDGLVYPIVWSRAGEDRMLMLQFPNGETYSLKPGNTWFEVIGRDSLFRLGEDGNWYFDFRIP
jgi:hypothetical protein